MLSFEEAFNKGAAIAEIDLLLDRMEHLNVPAEMRLQPLDEGIIITDDAGIDHDLPNIDLIVCSWPKNKFSFADLPSMRRELQNDSFMEHFGKPLDNPEESEPSQLRKGTDNLRTVYDLRIKDWDGIAAASFVSALQNRGVILSLRNGHPFMDSLQLDGEDSEHEIQRKVANSMLEKAATMYDRIFYDYIVSVLDGADVCSMPDEDSSIDEAVNRILDSKGAKLTDPLSPEISGKLNRCDREIHGTYYEMARFDSILAGKEPRLDNAEKKRIIEKKIKELSRTVLVTGNGNDLLTSADMAIIPSLVSKATLLALDTMQDRTEVAKFLDIFDSYANPPDQFLPGLQHNINRREILKTLHLLFCHTDHEILRFIPEMLNWNILINQFDIDSRNEVARPIREGLILTESVFLKKHIDEWNEGRPLTMPRPNTLMSDRPECGTSCVEFISTDGLSEAEKRRLGTMKEKADKMNRQILALAAEGENTDGKECVFICNGIPGCLILRFMNCNRHYEKTDTLVIIAIHEGMASELAKMKPDIHEAFEGNDGALRKLARKGIFIDRPLASARVAICRDALDTIIQ